MLNEKRQTWKVTCTRGQEPGQCRQGATGPGLPGVGWVQRAHRGADPAWVSSALPASSQETGKPCGSHRLVCERKSYSGRFHIWIPTCVPVRNSTWLWRCHARVCTHTPVHVVGFDWLRLCSRGTLVCSFPVMSVRPIPA